MTPARRASWAAVAAGALLASAWLLDATRSTAGAQEAPVGVAASAPAADTPPAPPAEAPAASAASAASPAAPRLAASLAGSELDGDWALAPTTGLPRPSVQLRRRFDHLLTQLGERTLEEIRAQLQALVAGSALSAAAQAAVLDRFDVYVGLGRHPWRVQVDPRAPHTWAAALAERQLLRRQRLGAAWAEAFYAEEDAELQAALEGRAPPDPTPPPVLPDAAQREAALDAAWQDWQRRLNAAQARWKALQQAVELSASQRDAAMAEHLHQQFKPDEQVRVRALLGL
ncbi:hypothetical protein [Roseateles sp. BYS87W]|uniref:Lipase helper protein n=1 Tax=Pelomonas baiyunensis TaxID=3299026 RepID=A0ABW7H0F6_9BURK